MKPELTLVEDTGSQLAQEKPAPEPPPQQTEMPFAVVEGEPLTELPRDLYIPPDALQVFLEAFEGPLDLLLYLIRRQNLDILDIPIAEITRQYMQYIEVMAELQLELAGEYLLMAAMLAEIKSRMLLPRPPTAEGEEEEDPRAELVRRLQEYERFKKAAEDIDQLARMERDTIIASAELQERKVVKLVPEVSLEEMLKAIKDVLSRAEMFAHHRISRERLSVRERMTHILDQLQESDNFCEFVRLFRPEEGRMGVTVTFSAVLELLKGGMIEIAQAEPYAPLHVRVPTGKRKVISDEASADADAQNQAALAQPAFPDEDELDDELEDLSPTQDGERDGDEDAADADAHAHVDTEADADDSLGTVTADDGGQPESAVANIVEEFGGDSSIDADVAMATHAEGAFDSAAANGDAMADDGAASADSADADAQNLAALAQPAFPDEDELDDELADDFSDLSLMQAVQSESDAAAHSGTHADAGPVEETAGAGGEADADAGAVVVDDAEAKVEIGDSAVAADAEAVDVEADADADAETVGVDAKAGVAAEAVDAHAEADALSQGHAVTHDFAQTGEVSSDAVDIDLTGDADAGTAVAADSSLDASDEFADQAAEVALDFSADDDSGSILDADANQLTDADLGWGESVEHAPEDGSHHPVEDDRTTSALEAEANELMDAGYANDASSSPTSGVAVDFSAANDADADAVEPAPDEQEQVDVQTDERREPDPDATPEDDMSEPDALPAQDADTRHE